MLAVVGVAVALVVPIVAVRVGDGVGVGVSVSVAVLGVVPRSPPELVAVAEGVAVRVVAVEVAAVADGCAWLSPTTSRLTIFEKVGVLCPSY